MSGLILTPTNPVSDPVRPSGNRQRVIVGDGTNGTTLNVLYRQDATGAISPLVPAAYTDEQAQDAVAAMLADSATIDATYNDAGNVETLDVITSGLPLATTSARGLMSPADRTRQVSNALGWVNLAEFGASTAATDATNRNALAAAVAALPSGGVIHVGEVYPLDAPTTIATAGIRIVGKNRNNAGFELRFATGDGLTFNEYYCGVENLKITTSVQRTSGFAIHAPQPYFEARNLLLYGIQGGATHFGGIHLGATSILSLVEDVEVRHWTGVAVQVNGAGDKTIRRLITDNVAANSAQAGIRVLATAMLQLEHCDVIHAGLALDLAPGAGVTVPSVVALNCFFDNSVIGLNMSSAGAVLRSTFTQCWFSSMTQAGISMKPVDANAKMDGVTFIGCNILNNIGGVTGVGVDTNAFTDKWKMVGCNIAGWATGINLVAGTEHYPTLLDNTIGAVSAFSPNTVGLAIGAGAFKGFLISSNDVIDNGTAFTLGAQTIATGTGARFRIYGNPGINPRGAVTTPAVPASGTDVQNLTGFVIQVAWRTGATTAPTAFRLNGVTTVLPAAAQLHLAILEPGGSMGYTGTVAPTMTWVAQ